MKKKSLKRTKPKNKLRLKLALVAVSALLRTSLIADVSIVKVGDFYFQDQTSMTNVSRIRRGDSVRWEWVNGFHTTTEINALWDCPIEATSQSYQRTFRKPGKWDYVCSRHPGVMRGSVIVDGEQTPIEPNSFSVFPGIVISGGLDELLDSDDQRLIVQPGPSFAWTSEWPATVRLSGLVPPGTGLYALTLKVESQSNAGGIVQRIRFYDHVGRDWEEFDLSLMTTSDSVREAIVNDPARFITPATGTVIAEVSYNVAWPTIYPWQARIDQIQWIAQ